MDILKEVRNAIDVMREYKRTHRLISTLNVYAAEDVFAELKKTGVMIQNYAGKYFLDHVMVTELVGYPKGYFSVE